MRLIVLALTAVLTASSAFAHEFWLEPTAYRIAPGDPVSVRAFNGENFFGIEYGYSERGFSRSGIFSETGRAPLTGTQGRKPAVTVPPVSEGLNVVFHASSLNTLVYPNVTKFENFLKGKHLEAAMERHRALKYPDAQIKEVYFRYVKALVGVGDGAGRDGAVGMPYELVALTNPYTDTGPMRFRLLLSGKAVGADVPAFVFHKVGTKVEKITLETDENGDLTVPRMAGAFMVNSVHLTEPTEKIREATKAHWVTLWASSTYEIAP